MSEIERRGLRASDDDRDRTLGELREHFVAGRLRDDEFARRMEITLRAETTADLVAVTDDLPSSRRAPIPGRTRRARHWIVALIGDHKVRGRWRPAEKMRAVMLIGDMTLDFTKADFDGDEIVVDAFQLIGSVKVIVPHGMDVEVGGFSLIGSRDDRSEPDPRSGLPRLQLNVVSIIGDLQVRVAR